MPPTMGKNRNRSGLGRAIINRRAQESRKEHEQLLHTTELPSGLSSVTQESSLEEFLNSAQLADTDFSAERNNSITIKSTTSNKNPYLLTAQEAKELKEQHDAYRNNLRVPRRPRWNRGMSKEELERRERSAFLDWRRGLAELQDSKSFLLTPFERNLSVWRQLWRTIERSHLVVQIVDARNPLNFRCTDLEEYVLQVQDPPPLPFMNRVKRNAAENGAVDMAEHDEQDEQEGEEEEDNDNDNEKAADHYLKRKNLLLINKADLLTPKQRLIWANYFEASNIQYAFFSATDAVALLEENEQTKKLVEKDEEEELDEEDEDDIGSSIDDDEKRERFARILNVDELEDLFLSKVLPSDDEKSLIDEGNGRVTVGLVGYPNVGKSSTINALVGSKKVSVSSTPGKTKHFQTIILSDKVELCDCPGLVFPQFAATQADLICDGILPVDQMREYTAPADLVVRRISKDILEATYGISLNSRIEEEDGILTAHGLLSAYAAARGYYTQGQGIADESRAARYILKDYVNAKLLYCHPPPEINEVAFNQEVNEKALNIARAKGRKEQGDRQKDTDSFKTGKQSLDDEFFGRTDGMGYTFLGGNDAMARNQAASSGKKHFKGDKRRVKKGK